MSLKDKYQGVYKLKVFFLVRGQGFLNKIGKKERNIYFKGEWYIEANKEKKKEERILSFPTNFKLIRKTNCLGLNGEMKYNI